MTDQPSKMLDQLSTIVDKLDNIQKALKKPKINKYKYQALIDYLKAQGKQSELTSSSSRSECLELEQVLQVLQELVQ